MKKLRGHTSKFDNSVEDDNVLRVGPTHPLWAAWGWNATAANWVCSLKPEIALWMKPPPEIDPGLLGRIIVSLRGLVKKIVIT
jgi:hypothetical protein